MEDVRLLLVLLAMVAALVLGLRPGPHSPRDDRSRQPGVTKRPSGSVVALDRMAGRNRWDRSDLARAIGRDELDSSAITACWPVAIQR